MLFTNVTSEPFCFLYKLHLFNNFSLSAETCGATAILDYIYFPIPLKLYINGFNARIWSVYAVLKGLNGSTLPYLAWLFRIGRGRVGGSSRCYLYRISSLCLRVDTQSKTFPSPAVQMQDNETQVW